MRKRVLVVTEDPDFLEVVRERLDTFDVVACMGPAQRSCLMDRDGVCGLAQRSDLVLVDSPVTGEFFDHYHGIPAISYAERLAGAHPDTEVVLCDPVRHGEVPNAFLSRDAALHLIEEKSDDGTERRDR
jgi:hypothetical protein